MDDTMNPETTNLVLRDRIPVPSVGEAYASMLCVIEA